MSVLLTGGNARMEYWHQVDVRGDDDDDDEVYHDEENNSLDISGQNYYVKTMLNYIPNERPRLGRPLKKLLGKASAGLKAKLVTDDDNYYDHYYYYYYYYFSC